MTRLGFADFCTAERVTKGMSGDEKFRVVSAEGAQFLLRLSDRGQERQKAAEFALMQTAHAHGIRVSRPYSMGEFEDGRIYQLTEWCNGIDLEKLLPQVKADEARRLGRLAGCLLRNLHSIAGPEAAEPWDTRFTGKIAARRAEIAEYGLDCVDIQLLADYLSANIAMLSGLPQCFNHGDFNPGNLILLTTGELAAIDFNSYNGGYGDPFFEMSTIWLDEGLPEIFRKGFSEGYFPSGIPGKFGAIMEYYHLYGLLASLCEEEDSASILMRIHQEVRNI